MSFNTILFVAAVVCFVVALIVPVKFDLVTLGLALFAAGHIPFRGRLG